MKKEKLKFTCAATGRYVPPSLETCFACEGRGGLMFMFKDGAHSVPCHVCEGRGKIGEGFMKLPIVYDKTKTYYQISASLRSR